MERVTYPIDQLELERTAGALGVNIAWGPRARCQHGFTSRETCQDCEGGYTTDTATYATLRGPVATLPDGRRCWTVTDDLEDVGYIPARYQYKVDGAHVAYTVDGAPWVACKKCRPDRGEANNKVWWHNLIKAGRLTLTGFNAGPCSFCGAPA